MNENIIGKLSVRTGTDGVYVEASDGVPASLMIQIIDAYLVSKNQENNHRALVHQQQINKTKEEKVRHRLKDGLQSVFVLSVLIISLGFVAQVAGCGQKNPYNQQTQWGAGK